MIAAEQIANLYARRLLAAGPDHMRMREVQQLVDGDIVVALPELNQAEKSSVPNRAKSGIQQLSQRLASARPDLICPVLRPTIKESRDRAENRRRAILGWWGYSKMSIVLRQRARYMLGYAQSPVQIRWNPALGVPTYEARNPLDTYPGHMRGPADMCPPDCIFETSQSLKWLQDNYREAVTLLSKRLNRDGQPDRDVLYTVLEYEDAYECVMVVLGQKQDAHTSPAPGSMVIELERYENRSERCPVVVPRQICLSRLSSGFDGAAGMYTTEAILTALSIQAIRKGVWQEEWLVARQGETPDIKQVPNPAIGEPGILVGGDLVPRTVDPQYGTNMASDRLAAAQLEQMGLSSELQGNAPTNVRTGRRAQVLLSNVIDFPIQEAQELFQESVQEENRIAIAFAKAYGDGKKSFYVRWDGARGDVTYDPADTFETDENVVKYPLAGADQAGMVIAYGQRVGMETMSKETFMQNDPAIDDAVMEQRRIVVQKVRDAVLAALQQQANAGTLPMLDVNAVLMDVVGGTELEVAIDKAQKAAQERQAAQVPASSPEAQPGLSMPGMGVESASAAPAAPLDLASALASLRRPQQGVTPQEQLASGPAA